MNFERLRWPRLRCQILFRPRLKEAELDREMQFHLDQLIEENIASGIVPAAAHLSAQKEFGSPDKFAEAVRDSWRPPLLVDLLADFRFTLRQITKSPGFAAIVTLTLAIAIGASTAIFSIVNSVAPQPLNYADPGQLIELRQVRPVDQREFSPNLEVVQEFQNRATVFSHIAAAAPMRGNLSGVDIPVRIFGNTVTTNYFDTLGVEPMLGRTFTSDEGTAGKTNVVILNHAFWLTQFNGDFTVVNRVVLLNNERFTIIGVMPSDFRSEAGAPKALFSDRSATGRSRNFCVMPYTVSQRTNEVGGAHGPRRPTHRYP